MWDFIRFGAQAKVIGKRSTKYRDPVTGREIETEIESAAWQITDQEQPKQGSLFSEHKPAPLRVYIVISQQWQPLFENPRLAQFYPLGELLGEIPPHKPGGDWARLIGLTLARVWRVHPRETIAREFSPTRRELLTHFAPKTKTVQEILSTGNPKHAVEYYCDALNILFQKGLIAPEGDAAIGLTATKMIEPYGRQGWQKAWLDGHSHLFPGKKWIPTAEERKSSLPPLKPKDLKAKPQKRKRV